VIPEADPEDSAPFDTAETSSALASAAPVRVGGTRARAGNAMGRTRVGILEATGRAVEKYGVRRATMGDVASVAGIAKGTLYNHFRTKNDLLTAAIAAGIEALGDDCVAMASSNGEAGLAGALRHAAETLSAHPALVRVAAEEPAELIRLLLPGYDGAWPAARAAVARVIAAAFPAETLEPEAGEVAEGSALDSAFTETVLRWLVTFTGAPGVPAETAAGAALLAHAIANQPSV
jgi:AcrR family transcriptional regulator